MDTCADCAYYEAQNGKGYCKKCHPCISPTEKGLDGQYPVVEGTAKACGDFE